MWILEPREVPMEGHSSVFSITTPLLLRWLRMLWGHVRIVYRHSEKNFLRKNILGFGPFDHCLEGSFMLVNIQTCAVTCYSRHYAA